MAYPVTLNGRTYTLADFEGTNYVDGLPDAFEDFVTHAGDIYNDTSTSSIAIGTGSKTFTVSSAKPYQAGTPLRIADSANPETNFLDCIVTSYSGTTLVVNAFGYAGSGTIASWTINIGGAKTVDGTLAVSQGGTGATTASDARTNLDVYSKADADSRFLNVSGEASNVTMTGDVTIGDTSGDTLTVNATATFSNGVSFGDNVISGDDIDGGTISNFASTGIDDNAASTAITIDSSQDVTFTSDAIFPDNGKAIFGAGSDLQIYHDGSNSYIRENGTGLLYIGATDKLLIQDSTLTNTSAKFDTNADVSLYYNNDKRLETTSTGIDVTGTAVTDGLTVAGNVSVDGGTIKLDGDYPIGGNNVALGNTALDDGSLTGSANTAIGSGSMTVNTSGAENTAVGKSSLASNTTGSYNVAFGKDALVFNTTASNNTAVGYRAGYSNTTGFSSTYIGYQAGYSTTTGVGQIAMGNQALYSNTTGTTNTALGGQSLFSNTTGSGNTATGYQAAYSNTTGTLSAFGYQAGTANTTGISNSAFGAGSLISNTTGSANTAVGESALRSNTTASNNTALGYKAGYSGTTASENVIIGTNAGYSITTGVNNTFVGGANPSVAYGAGGAITTGSKNTIIGRFDGNQGGLDIRTANNHIVLSDGDGNPRGIFDASGNLLIGRTEAQSANNVKGCYIDEAGAFIAQRGGAASLFLNRFTSDGDIAIFRKDGTTVGSIGSEGGNSLTIGNGDTGLLFSGANDAIHAWNTSTNASRDGAIDLGRSSQRFKDLYLSGGAYLGGTAAANKLDDYEEGTWSLNLNDSGNVAKTLTTNDCYYTRIGEVVHVWGNIASSNALTDPNYYILSNLPFIATYPSGRSALAGMASQGHLVYPIQEYTYPSMLLMTDSTLLLSGTNAFRFFATYRAG